MFISNNRTSFHVWWNENLIKHRKVSKYDLTHCRIIQICKIQWRCSLFSDFDRKQPIWVNLVQNVKIVSLTLKFATETNLNMQNSIMFTFSDLKLQHHCWVNLVQKIKIVRLSWNLVPRLIWICRIQRCGSFYLYYGWKYPFWANLVHKIEFVLLRWN